MNYFCWTFFDTVFESYEETISFEDCLKNILLYCWLHSLQQNLTILLYNTSFYDQNLLLWLENEFFFKLLSSFFIDCLYAIWKHRNNSTRKEEQQKTCLDIQIYIVALKSILLNKRQNRETFLFSTQDCIELVNVCPNPPDTLENDDLGLKDFKKFSIYLGKNRSENWEKKVESHVR